MLFPPNFVDTWICDQTNSSKTCLFFVDAEIVFVAENAIIIINTQCSAIVLGIQETFWAHYVDIKSFSWQVILQKKYSVKKWGIMHFGSDIKNVNCIFCETWNIGRSRWVFIWWSLKAFKDISQYYYLLILTYRF